MNKGKGVKNVAPMPGGMKKQPQKGKQRPFEMAKRMKGVQKDEFLSQDAAKRV